MPHKLLAHQLNEFHPDGAFPLSFCSLPAKGYPQNRIRIFKPRILLLPVPCTPGRKLLQK
jgi:hypothetical protein